MLDSQGGGMASVEITRCDLNAAQLREAAMGSADAKQVRRILAIAMVLDGHSRLPAARAGGIGSADAARLGASLQCRGSGRADGSPSAGPHVTPERCATGGGGDVGGGWSRLGERWHRTRWRRADLRDRIKDRFEVVLHERSVGKLLHKPNFSCISGASVASEG